MTKKNSDNTNNSLPFNEKEIKTLCKIIAERSQYYRENPEKFIYSLIRNHRSNRVSKISLKNMLNVFVYISIEDSNIDLLDILLNIKELCIDINQRNEDSLTPLMYAIQLKDMRAVKKILEYSPEINMQDRQGHSALTKAVLGNYIEGINILITHNADLKQKDKNNLSFFDHAKNMNIELDYTEPLTQSLPDQVFGNDTDLTPQSESNTDKTQEDRKTMHNADLEQRDNLSFLNHAKNMNIELDYPEPLTPLPNQVFDNDTDLTPQSESSADKTQEDRKTMHNDYSWVNRVNNRSENLRTINNNLCVIL